MAPLNPIHPIPPVPWARFTRHYLALRRKEFLQQAIAEALKGDEIEVADVLRARQEQDWEKVDEIPRRMHRNFIETGRNEEAATIALVCLEVPIFLAENSMDLPEEYQAAALEAGVQACQQAVSFAKALADEPCQAFYKQTEGKAFTKWSRLAEAERAFVEALEMYRRLGKKVPEIYQPKVAVTLNYLTLVLKDENLLERAEQTCREALALYRKLAALQPVYEPMVAAMLNNLGVVLQDRRQLKKAEQTYKKELELYRKLAKQQAEVYEPNIAESLRSLGTVFREQGRFDHAEKSYKEALNLYRILATRQPNLYVPEMAETLNNLGFVRVAQQRGEESEQSHTEALVLYRQLAKQKPKVYDPYVAGTLKILGILHLDQGRFDQSEKNYLESLELYRQLAVTEPLAYEPDMAEIWNSLGKVFRVQLQFDKAEESYQNALKIRRKLASHQSVVHEAEIAMTLQSLAVVFWEQRRLEHAQQTYQEALQIERKLAIKQPGIYEPKVAATLVNIGAVHRERNRPDKATQVLQEALHLYRKLARERRKVYEPNVAGTLQSIGGSLTEQRQLVKAKPILQEALKLYRKLNARQDGVYEFGVAMTLNSLGTVLREERSLEESEQSYRDALLIYRKLALKQPQMYQSDVAMALHNLGYVLRERRQMEQAEESSQEALDLYLKLAAQQPLVHERHVAGAYNNLGLVYQDLSQPNQAEQNFRDAMELYRKLAAERPGIYEPELAMTYSNLGHVLRKRKRLEQAEESSQEALKLYRELAVQQPQTYGPDVAMTLTNLGNVRLDQQRLGDAEESYLEALGLYRKLAAEQPDVYEPNLVGTLHNLGGVLWNQKRREQGERFLREGLALCRRHDRPLELVGLLSLIGQLLMYELKWDEAVDAFKEAADQVERLRTEGVNLDRRMQILRDNIHIFERLLICLVKLERHGEALEVAERGKGRTLIDLLTLRDLRPKNAPAELSQEYERMLFQARILEDRLQRGEGQATGLDSLPPEERIRRQQEQIKVVRAERLRVNIRLQELVNEIRRHDPDFLPHAKPMSLTEIKTLAHDVEATLIVFRVTEAGSFIFLVLPDGDIDVVQAPEFTTNVLSEILVKFENEEAVEGWVVRYYAYQNAQYQAQQTRKKKDKESAKHAGQVWLDTMDATLGDLYQQLLSSVHHRLKEWTQKTGENIERVVMVSNRGLAILPLHACWWNEDEKRRYLLDDYVITYSPSLSVFKRCVERERRGRSKQTLLGIANPKPPGNLVFSEWECEEIKRLLGNERCLFLLGKQATKAEMMNRIWDRNWLHFSCHGQYRLDAPLESSLSLAQGDELTLGEILEKLDLQHTWLIVLSACETGLVDYREIADEHYGLPLGFLFAGAPTVWGSLWTVNDLSTALLMREAYQNLSDDMASKPEALRKAQCWLRDAKAHELVELISSKQAALGYDRMGWTDLSPMQRSVQHGYDPQATPYSHPYYWAGMQCVGN